MTMELESAAVSSPIGQGRREHLRFRIGRLPVHLALLLLCAIWLVPVVEGIATSFRTLAQVNASGWWHVFSTPVTLQSYRSAWGQSQISGAFLNSVLLTLPSNVLEVCVAAVAAYVFSRVRFLGRNVALAGIVALMLVPTQVTLIPVFTLFEHLGIAGQLPAVWLYQAAYGMPLAIFILVIYFDTIPGELFEAAEIDGAGAVQVFLRVAVPLARPGLLSVFILHFLACWNDLLIPLLFVGPESAPLPVKISTLMQDTSQDPLTVVAASALISVAVPAVLFFTLQRFFVRGLTGGSLKG